MQLTLSIKYGVTVKLSCSFRTSTKPNIAAIENIPDSKEDVAADSEIPCSISAVITVTQKSPDEDIAVILAEEEGMKKCEKCMTKY